MTIESYVRPELNLVIFVHAGIVPDDEFLSLYKSFFESGKFKPAMNILVDLREANSSSRTSDALRHFAGFMQSKQTDTSSITKVAVVAPKDISFGLARMYEIFSSLPHWNYVVFRNMDTALAWLGLPEDLTISHSQHD